ncbi:MAG: sugar-binding transcriptional regulator [Chloroflexota bacterium]|jgi:DNA-binding transcriptional regulator LsrR (DeoR family)
MTDQPTLNSNPEEARLLAKVARLYYEDGLRQAQIAEQLDLSQATVSRLLKRALDQQVVRITVSSPTGYYPELERGVREAYGLKEVTVVDHSPDYGRLLRNLGSAAAYYLETTIKPDEVIGVSSWSESLLSTANAMHPLRTSRGKKVIQIEGGIGNPSSGMHASQMTKRLAELCGTEAVMLQAPGIVSSVDTRQALLADPYVQEVIGQWDEVTLALVGIGTTTPSRMLALSGNAFSEEELQSLADLGAVGDINLHFFDAVGQRIESTLDGRVITMGLDQLRRVGRCVAIAGGERKWQAIRAAIRGGWIHVLVTDSLVARRLLDDSS